MTSNEKRLHQRIDREIKVEVRVANFHEVLKTKNTSDGGLFLHAGEQPMLPVRTIVCLSQESTETVLGRIVWLTEDGMGVEYIDKPANCCKKD